MNLNHARLPIPPPGLAVRTSWRGPSETELYQLRQEMLQRSDKPDNRQVRILMPTDRLPLPGRHGRGERADANRDMRPELLTRPLKNSDG